MYLHCLATIWNAAAVDYSPVSEEFWKERCLKSTHGPCPTDIISVSLLAKCFFPLHGDHADNEWNYSRTSRVVMQEQQGPKPLETATFHFCIHLVWWCIVARWLTRTIKGYSVCGRSFINWIWAIGSIEYRQEAQLNINTAGSTLSFYLLADIPDQFCEVINATLLRSLWWQVLVQAACWHQSAPEREKIKTESLSAAVNSRDSRILFLWDFKNTSSVLRL